MTGLTNSATGGNTAFQAPLSDPVEEAGEPAPAEQPNIDSWRSEVAARLARYRTRRKPRAPRYPSLLLPFDTSDNRSRPASAPAAPSLVGLGFEDSLARHHLEANRTEADREDDAAVFSAASPSEATASPRELQRKPQRDTQSDYEPEQFANVIEFPRSAAIPVFHASALADPIFDRPRIVEAPEVIPPPPALGGILIEPARPEPDDLRAAADVVLKCASIPRRLLAGIVDGSILLAALAGFAAVFLKLNPVRGPLPLLAGVAVSMAILLWMSYQFLFVVCTGSTPGLRAARLRLAKFDGSPVTRRLRHWRVFASFLSAFSAALGYLWCFVDQDSLCWHDRITRTHIQSSK